MYSFMFHRNLDKQKGDWEGRGQRLEYIQEENISLKQLWHRKRGRVNNIQVEVRIVIIIAIDWSTSYAPGTMLSTSSLLIIFSQWLRKVSDAIYSFREGEVRGPPEAHCWRPREQHSDVDSRTQGFHSPAAARVSELGPPGPRFSSTTYKLVDFSKPRLMSSYIKWRWSH